MRFYRVNSEHAVLRFILFFNISRSWIRKKKKNDNFGRFCFALVYFLIPCRVSSGIVYSSKRPTIECRRPNTFCIFTDHHKYNIRFLFSSMVLSWKKEKKMPFEYFVCGILFLMVFIRHNVSHWVFVSNGSRQGNILLFFQIRRGEGVTVFKMSFFFFFFLLILTFFMYFFVSYNFDSWLMISMRLKTTTLYSRHIYGTMAQYSRSGNYVLTQTRVDCI